MKKKNTKSQYKNDHMKQYKNDRREKITKSYSL